jgi:uncharacterized Zn finger protein
MDITQPKIDIKKQPTVSCEKCGSTFFREVVLMKKISKLLTGSNEDSIVPFPTYRCDDCNHINDDFKLFDEGNKLI